MLRSIALVHISDFSIGLFMGDLPYAPFIKKKGETIYAEFF